MNRRFILFAKLWSARGVPVTIDRAAGSREIRIRYGEKIQRGNTQYVVTPQQCQIVVRRFLHDRKADGRPFRHPRRHA